VTRYKSPPPRVDYWTLAELRYQIRRFLSVRERAARAAGIEPQQYLVLLQLKGVEGPVTIGTLAERLQIRHHSAVELVDRLATRGMVTRRRDRRDGRGVVVELRPLGARVLEKLATYSVEELRIAGPSFVEVLARLVGRRRNARAASARERKP
jgi:DNA-binding MarR family transcriptional regulator